VSVEEKYAFHERLITSLEPRIRLFLGHRMPPPGIYFPHPVAQKSDWTAHRRLNPNELYNGLPAARDNNALTAFSRLDQLQDVTARFSDRCFHASLYT
jgi:hypothetical protein